MRAEDFLSNLPDPKNELYRRSAIICEVSSCIRDVSKYERFVLLGGNPNPARWEIGHILPFLMLKYREFYELRGSEFQDETMQRLRRHIMDLLESGRRDSNFDSILREIYSTNKGLEEFFDYGEISLDRVPWE